MNGLLELGLPCFEASTNDRRGGRRQLPLDGEVEIDRRGRMKSPQPGLVGDGLRAAIGDPMRLATVGKVDDHIPLQVGHDLVGTVIGRFTLVDPEDGITRRGHNVPLADLATAAHQPHVNFALAPATGLLCFDMDRSLDVRHGGLDSRGGDAGQQATGKQHQAPRSATTSARMRARTTVSSWEMATRVQNGGILAQVPSPIGSDPFGDD